MSILSNYATLNGLATATCQIPTDLLSRGDFYRWKEVKEIVIIEASNLLM